MKTKNKHITLLLLTCTIIFIFSCLDNDNYKDIISLQVKPFYTFTSDGAFFKVTGSISFEYYDYKGNKINPKKIIKDNIIDHIELSTMNITIKYTYDINISSFPSIYLDNNLGIVKEIEEEVKNMFKLNNVNIKIFDFKLKRLDSEQVDNILLKNIKKRL